jgi:transcription termination factor Rho
MTETTDTAPATGGRKGGLSAMLLPELKQLAGGLGIKATGMRKGDLIEAIKAAQVGSQSGSQSSGPKSSGNATERAPRNDSKPEQKNDQNNDQNGGRARPDRDEQQDRAPQRDQRRQDQDDRGQDDREQGREQNREQNRGRNDRDERDQNRDANRTQDRDGENRNRNQDDRQNQGGNRNNNDQNQDNRQNQGGNRTNNTANDDEGGSRRNRRRRGRDRNTQGPSQGGGGGGTNNTGGGPRNRNEPDLQILEDDVLAPCAGILDLMDNYAFVRTSGYLPGVDDVYVSMSMVRKFGLRRGDAVTGQVRQPREGERKEKYNPLVKLDTVNGADPESSRTRVEFSKLTPLYPSERLRLETTSTNLIGRVIDIAAPIGKGQRGLIVSPSKAGKTMIMQSIANSITTNNPECHLMVVLVDERPEEVTDFERSVKGEVVSSTFDRPAADHTIVAELAIERAKRLVELGHDVVVLLDGITRLGRAYNLAAPASGRILSGGVDSAALYPPKRFFGAARNIEDGGSLTILATALIESGSKMDEVIFEEFKGTGNMEIRLRRDFADKRIFPAIDAVQSGTRREELLMSKEELSIIWKLRRVLSGLDGQQALELLLERLKKSQNNIEFLMQVQKTTPTAGGKDD